MIPAPIDPHHRPAILLILILTYAGIALGRVPGLKLNRTGIALLGAICMMIFGGVSTSDVVAYINWPTIFLLFGFFVISAQLRLSGFYTVVAESISAKLGHPAQFLLVLMTITAVFSAFLSNDIACFIFTPIVGAALLRKHLNPIPFLIAIAIASNTGAAATLIGNPQNMMIAQVAHLGFGQYLLWSIVPVLFALACAYGIIWLMSQKNIETSGSAKNDPGPPDYPFNRPHTIKGLITLLVVIGLFFTSLPKEIVALAAAGFHLASNKYGTDDLLSLVDWSVLILFMGLFVVTGSFQATGYGDQLVHWLAHGGMNLNTPHTLIPTTVVLANLISNSATVMMLLKVLDLSQTSTAYILTAANSLGGSLLMIGAVSNLIVVQQAKGLGINIRFRDFARLSIPATLIALGGLLLWVML